MGVWCSSQKYRARLRRMRKLLVSLVEYAEARLVARRQARAEAREIRMRELEKQKEAEEHDTVNHYDERMTEPVRPPRGIRPESRESRSASIFNSGGSCGSSRRSSEEYPDTIGSKEYKLLTSQVTELEEKFRKAMITTAQLDNEKTTISYEVDTAKDQLEEIEEQYLLVQKDYKSVSRAHELLNRDFKELKEENELLKECIKQRDELISEHGLVLVGGEEEEKEVYDEDDDDDEPKEPKVVRTISQMALVTQEAAEILKQAGSGSLDARLKKLAEEKQELLDEIYRLRLDLEEEKQKGYKMEQLSLTKTGTNSPETKLMEMQRETSKQISDYKYKLKKAEQEITTLQSSVTRLEGQVNRFKTQIETAETTEDELKSEKRRLQRELREAQARVEELETANDHLQKRIDKLKTVKNALIKS